MAMEQWQTDFQHEVKRQRDQGWGWRWDGLDDWSTETIVHQLREIGVDTDAARFHQQAAAAGAFKVLDDQWNAQISDDKRYLGFWEDFPMLAVPVLWDRLTPDLVCADLIERRLYHVIRAAENKTPVPDVGGLPAEVAAVVELAEFLERSPAAHRAAEFRKVKEGRYYDYGNWLSDLVLRHGPKHPDQMTRMVDALADCELGHMMPADLALALALAGRPQEAIARARSVIERFPDDVWARILAADVFREVGDHAEAERLWILALDLATNFQDWEAAADRLREHLDPKTRDARMDEILREHPAPARPPSPTPSAMPSAPPPLPRLDLPTRARKVGRNEPCPCGSGKKYKKCCMLWHPGQTP